jgi:hypothetical protein
LPAAQQQQQQQQGLLLVLLVLNVNHCCICSMARDTAACKLQSLKPQQQQQ